MSAPEIRPLEQINFGKPLAITALNAMLYELREHPSFLGILAYLRDEAYAQLNLSMKLQRAGKPEESALPMGAFDGLSQVIVKLNQLALTAPEIEE